MDYTNGMVSYSSGPHDGDSSSGSEDDEHRPMTPRMNCVTPEIKSESTPSKEARDRSYFSEDDVPLPLTKKFRMEQPLVNDSGENAGIDLSMKDDHRSVENHSSEVKDLRGAPTETTLASSFNPSLNTVEVMKREVVDDAKSNAEPKDLSKVNSENNIKTENHNNNFNSKSNMVEKERQISSTKSVRKRKSLNPIKCQTASDDDLQFASSDDSSSDTYIDQDNDDNGMLDSKSDYLTSDASDSLNDLDDMDNSDSVKDKFSNVNMSRKSLTPPTSSVVATTFQTASTKNSLEKDYHTPEKYNGFSMSDLSKFRQEMSSSKPKDNEDICENPLRHLESLSLGAFNNLLSMNNRTPNFSHRGASGVSYHAPGLGLASVTTTTAPNRVESPVAETMPVNNSGPHHHQPAISSSNCHLSNNSDTENSMSDQQMAMMPVYRDASMVGSLEIPVDKENPRRCTACGKIFQNHFGVKTHYQNVHLKLMHKCTVEGCNAAFPSKRSRDRHSANLNLHRKLLSTSSDRSASGYFDKGGAMYPFHADAYRGDLFTRLYDHNSLPLSFADIYHNRLSVEGAGSPFLGASPFAHLPGAMPGFHPAFLSPNLTNFTTNNKSENHSRYHQDHNSSVSSISNPSSPSPKGSPREGGGSSVPSPSVKLEEELLPDPEGRFACTICEKKFHEGVVLREHYEKSHTQALLQCSMNGCNKVFLSRQSHDSHSDSLHKEKCVEAT